MRIISYFASYQVQERYCILKQLVQFKHCKLITTFCLLIFSKHFSRQYSVRIYNKMDILIEVVEISNDTTVHEMDLTVYIES